MGRMIKVKGSTLIETMVATVLIVIIFMIASLLMNNLIRSQMQGEDRLVQETLYELEYKSINQVMEYPYYNTVGEWEIVLQQSGEGDQLRIFATARHSENETEIKKSWSRP